LFSHFLYREVQVEAQDKSVTLAYWEFRHETPNLLHLWIERGIGRRRGVPPFDQPPAMLSLHLVDDRTSNVWLKVSDLPPTWFDPQEDIVNNVFGNLTITRHQPRQSHHWTPMSAINVLEAVQILLGFCPGH